MASVYKRKRDRQRKGSCWYFAFVDHVDGRDKRRIVKGCPDKVATEALARKLETEAAFRRRGLIDARDDAYSTHESQLLSEHLINWRDYLLAKGSSQRHANEGHARLVKLMTLAKTKRLSDLTPSTVQTALALLKAQQLSLRTIHHYTSLAKNFSRWAWHDGRTREDNLAHLRLPDNPESDRRRERRALTTEELLRLIQAAERGQEVRRLQGIDRAMLYRIAAGTGFRSEELQSLTRESFDLDREYPTVTLEAIDSKRRRRDVQPIQPALAALLRPWLAGKPLGIPLFPVTRWAILAAMQADLRAAGVAYETEEGFADFHALRHTFITALAKSNAPVKIVQSLARHSTPTLTLNCYSHVGLFDQSSALDALPDLTRPAPRSEPALKTGTDDSCVRKSGSALTAQGQRAGDGTVQVDSVDGGLSEVQPATLVMCQTPKNKPNQGSGRDCSGSVRIKASSGSVSVAGALPGLQNR